MKNSGGRLVLVCAVAVCAALCGRLLSPWLVVADVKVADESSPADAVFDHPAAPPTGVGLARHLQAAADPVAKDAVVADWNPSSTFKVSGVLLPAGESAADLQKVQFARISIEGTGPRDSLPRKSAVTDGDGRFAFELDRANWRRYDICPVRAVDRQGGVLFQGSVVIDSYFEMMSRPTTRYSGWFVDGAGMSIPGRFSLYEARAGCDIRRLGGGNTDQSGHFALEADATDADEVVAVFVSSRFGHAKLRATVSVAALRSNEGAVIGLAARRMALIVSDEAGMPIAGVLVRYREVGVRSQQDAFIQAVSDLSGEVGWWSQAAAVDLVVVHDMFATRHLRVTGSETLRIVMRPKSVQVVRGQVVDSGGDPVGMATVAGFPAVPYPDAIPDIASKSETDAAGRFQVEVPLSHEGCVALWVLHPETLGVTGKVASLCRFDQELVVTIPRLARAVLVAATRSSSGRAISGMPDYVLVPVGSGDRIEGVMPGGECELRLPSGEYTAFVSYAGIAGRVRMVASGDVPRTQVTMATNRKVRCRIRSIQTIAGAEVSVVDSELGVLPGSAFRAKADADGAFGIELPSCDGDYSLAVVHGGQRRQFLLGEGDAFEFDWP